MKKLISKRITAVLLTAVLVVMLLPVSSFVASAEGEGFLEFTLAKTVKDGYSVKAVSTDISGDLVIPSEYNGLPVTEIGRGAFQGCSELENVEIPNTVKRIMTEAFSGCYNLSTVIPESVVEVGENAFNNTPYYENNWENGALYIDGILIKSNYSDEFQNVTVREGTRVIADKAFGDNWELSSITFPESLTHIGYSAFNNCVNLKNIKLPDSLEYIGDNAFNGCSEIESLYFGGNVEYIGSNSFGNCEKLYDFTIPESVTVIGAGAFGDTAYYNNSSNWENGVLYKDNCLIAVNKAELPKKYTINNRTRVIVDNAFFFCSDLEEVVIPQGVEKICDFCFHSCEKLKSVNIPDTVTYIGVQAFYECLSLEKLTVLDSVEFIGSFAFPNRNKNLIVYGYKNSVAESAAESCSVKFSPIGVLLSDEATGVSVAGDFSSNAVLKVSADVAQDGFKYNIEVENSDGEVKNITLRIPFESEENETTPVLYRINETDTYRAENTTVAGGKLVLKTATLGEFLLSNERFFTVRGDVNGDGILTPSDVVLLRRYFANFDSETETSAISIFPGADVNGDGKLTPSDVVLLRRYFANFDSETGESSIELPA